MKLLKGGDDLDRLTNSLLERHSAAGNITTHSAATPAIQPTHRQRQSNTQQAVFTSWWKQVERWKWEGSWKTQPMLSTSLQVVFCRTDILDLYPIRRVLEDCTTMSSSFHLSPLKLKKPLGLRLTGDYCGIQIKEKTTTKLSQLVYSSLFLSGAGQKHPRETSKTVRVFKNTKFWLIFLGAVKSTKSKQISSVNANS